MLRHAQGMPCTTTETSMTDRAARNQQKSLEAFLQQKARFDAMVSELQQMSADHFGADPDEVLWGKAATLEHWNSRLASVTDCYFKRGEFAE
jgi:hypothetical protein